MSHQIELIMTRIFILSFFLGGIIFSSCQNNSKKPTIIADELLEAMEAAYNLGDLQKVADFYADDAQLLAPGGYKVEGRQAVDDYWTKLNPIHWELTSIKVSENEQDLYQTDYWKNLKNKPPHWDEYNVKINTDDQAVYQLGHSKLQYKSKKTGNPHTSDVDFILVWKKTKNDGYKVFIDTYASN